MAVYYEIPIYDDPGEPHVATAEERAEYDAKATTYAAAVSRYNPLIVTTDPLPEAPTPIPEWDRRPLRCAGATTPKGTVEAMSVGGALCYQWGSRGLFRADARANIAGWKELTFDEALALATVLVAEKIAARGQKEPVWGSYGPGVYLIEQMREIDRRKGG